MSKDLDENSMRSALLALLPGDAVKAEPDDDDETGPPLDPNDKKPDNQTGSKPAAVSRPVPTPARAGIKCEPPQALRDSAEEGGQGEEVDGTPTKKLRKPLTRQDRHNGTCVQTYTILL